MAQLNDMLRKIQLVSTMLEEIKKETPSINQEKITDIETLVASLGRDLNQ